MRNDNLFEQWQEINAHIRHGERLLSENARSVIGAITASIGAAGLDPIVTQSVMQPC